MHVAKMMPVYIASFSAARDDAYQWTHYADDGRGVCLGVRALQEQPAVNEGIESLLIEVDYSKDSWRRHLDNTVRKIVAAVACAEACTETIALGAAALFRVAAIEATRAKQERWKSECENRVVSVVSDSGDSLALTRDEKERIGAAGKVIRYVELRIRHEPRSIALDEIAIGPHHPDPVTARGEIERSQERWRRRRAGRITAASTA